MNPRKNHPRRTKLSRRQLIRCGTAAAAFTIVPRHVLGFQQNEPAPSEKMNVGCIGVGGMQGLNDTRQMGRTENIYALCDVDERNLNKAGEMFPQAKRYRDFREMLDKEARNLQGCTVTIPDFMHATASLWAMERGIGVHCQKPLTSTIWEARLLAKAAKKYKVATQMGNQGYSSQATRIACEYIWNDEIGDVKEVHSWHRGGFSRGVTQWPPEEPVPEALNWDLWLGRAKERPYSSKIHPIHWRGFLEYGTMMIGDWGIHQLGPANWALGLGETYPTSVEALEVEGANEVTYPSYSCRIHWPERSSKYARSGKMPPVDVYWYEGSVAQKVQPPEGLTAEDIKGINEIFVGTKGILGTRGRGEGYTLLPPAKQVGHPRPPEVLERSPGHFQDWIRAVKTGKPACSNFEIAGPYTEWMLLGAIAWRFPNEKLNWDGKNLRFTNNDKANEFVKPGFRKGWELKDIAV